MYKRQVSGGICNPEGLNVPAILDYLSLNRKNLLKDYNEEGMSRITNEELLEMDARVLVPAALENQINASNAHKIRAEIIVEAANGPVAADADGILQERGITVVPDILSLIHIYIMDLYDVSQFLGFTGQNILQHLRISGEEFRAVQPGLAVVIDLSLIHISILGKTAIRRLSG